MEYFNSLLKGKEINVFVNEKDPNDTDMYKCFLITDVNVNDEFSEYLKKC